jgi:hypothetical protein
MVITTYDFPKSPAATGYCLFPAELEDNPLIVFHATPVENEAAILKEGFKADPKGVSKLQSVSFAKRSVGALTHAMGRRGNDAVDWVIFAVRYQSFANIKENTIDIHDYKLDPAPEIIGRCLVPASYEHR